MLCTSASMPALARWALRGPRPRQVLQDHPTDEVRIPLPQGARLGADAAPDIDEDDGRAVSPLEEALLEVQTIGVDGPVLPREFDVCLREAHCPGIRTQPTVGRLVCIDGAKSGYRHDAEGVFVLVRFEPDWKVQCSLRSHFTPIQRVSPTCLLKKWTRYIGIRALHPSQ